MQKSLNTEIYLAPKPASSQNKLLAFIDSTTFLPSIFSAFSIGIKLLKYFTASKLSKLILGAQNEDFALTYPPLFTQSFIEELPSTLKGQRYTIITHDGAQLDKLQISPTTASNEYIINFVGSGMCYEQILEEMKKDAEELNCHVIGFNFRNVSHSIGEALSSKDLVTDGIAQVQHLLDQGVEPRHIILKGFSLGAAIATLVAKHFYSHDKHINLFNDRSFSTLTKTITAQIRCNGTGHLETKKVTGTLAYPLVKGVLNFTDWEIDAASAYKDLPPESRTYTTVRSPSSLRGMYEEEVIDDSVIPYRASLHEAVKKTAENTPLLESSWTLIGQLAALPKKFHTRSMEDDGHGVSLENLVTRTSPEKTGESVFHEFTEIVLNRPGKL